jgi:8-oxo-dGTP pyrophosphatase MutT (NUDIX family)
VRKASRAIIIKDDQILVTKRNKFGSEYYILVGGGWDSGETAEQALHREIREEAGIEIANPRLVYIENAGDMYGVQHVFLCDFVSGEPQLHPESTESIINKMNVGNTFETVWLPLDKFQTVPFRSERLRRAVLAGLAHGFPEQPQDITDMYRD